MDMLGGFLLAFLALIVLSIFGWIFALLVGGLELFVNPPWREGKPTYPSIAESRGYKDVV